MNKVVKTYKNLTKPVKAVIWFTVCNILLKGISFITVPIFTRLLSESEYGKLSLLMSYEQLFLIFATWEIQTGAYQKGIFKYKEDVDGYTSSTILLVNLLTIIFFILLLFIWEPVNKFTQISATVMGGICIYFLVQPSYNTWLIRQRTEFRYKSAVVVTLVFALANVFLPIFSLYSFGQTAEIKYLSSLIASIAICACFYIPNIIRFPKLFTNWKKIRQQWSFMVQFEAPLILHSLSYLILNQADRVMIGRMVGNAEAAYYSVAYNLASIIGLFQVSINQALLPWRYQMLEQKNYHQIKKITNLILLFFGGIILLFVLISPEVMRFLFTSNYYEAVWSIPPVSLSIFFIFLYTIFVNIETYYEVTKYVMYVSVVCGLVNIGLNYLGIIQFGYIACAYATLISYILFSIGHYFFMKRILKSKHVAVGDVVDSKAILIISLSMIILVLITSYLYHFFILRYLCAIILLVLGILKKNLFISVFKTIKK